MNSWSNPARRDHLRERAALADYGLEGRQNLPTLAAQVRREEWRDEQELYSRFVSSEGLSALVNDGVTVFEEATGNRLPHNLTHGSGRLALVDVAGVSDPGRYGRRLRTEEANRLIETAARFGGWLKAAAELPGLRRLVKATQSELGVNSPRTAIDLMAFAARWPSPHQLERKLWAVRERAIAILAAYEGQTPSWRSIAWGLCVERRVGKAAVIAVAEHLALDPDGYRREHALFRTYRSAREWLVEHRTTRFSTTAVEPANAGGVAFPLATGEVALPIGWNVEVALHVDRFGRRRLAQLATSGTVALVLSEHEPIQYALPRAFERLPREAWDELSLRFRKNLSNTLVLATQLLDGWRGNPRPEERVVALALLKTGEVSKAAHIAALDAVGQGYLADREHHRPLEWFEHTLESFSDRANPVLDASDGVEGWYAPEPELVADDGATVTRGVTVDDCGRRQVIWLVRCGDRTYHQEGGWATAEHALDRARYDWARQDEHLVEVADLVRFLRGEMGFCPFVVRRDSAAAGNCSPGTEAWLRERGWVGRKWIPAVWLVPHLRDQRVRRVAVALKMRLQRELRA